MACRFILRDSFIHYYLFVLGMCNVQVFGKWNEGKLSETLCTRFTWSDCRWNTRTGPIIFRDTITCHCIHIEQYMHVLENYLNCIHKCTFYNIETWSVGTLLIFAEFSISDIFSLTSDQLVLTVTVCSLWENLLFVASNQHDQQLVCLVISYCKPFIKLTVVKTILNCKVFPDRHITILSLST